MAERILVIQGHPTAGGGHFGHALDAAYIDGAESGGRSVRLLTIAELGFPLLTSRADWESGPVPEVIAHAQRDVEWADHLVLFYPLWLGGMPALLKGFLEQTLRPGFAFSGGDAGIGHPRLKGRSARVVVTMGMPALLYRWYYRGHSLKSLERNILRFCGIAPVRHTLIGLVEGSDARRRRWLARIQHLGERGR